MQERLERLLMSPVAVPDLPLRVATYAYQEEEGSDMLRVLAATDVERDPADPEVTFGYRLIAPDGKTLASRAVEAQAEKDGSLVEQFAAFIVEPVDAPLTPERQMREPYTIGTYRVTPAYRLSFSRSEELTFFYVVYGAGPPGGAKPDLTVEYHFLRRTAGGEAYFTETEPERLNAQTMPPEFDMTLGHTIAGGRGVPLAPFPAGEYRLEIGVTDHTSGASVTREVTFTVQAP